MATRRIVVVDVESTGLRDIDICVEVAWHDLTRGDTAAFIPEHDVAWVFINGQPDALALNGYADRLADVDMQDDGQRLLDLHMALRGQVLAGANPAFDAAHLSRLFVRAGLHPDPWHHRLLDLSAYAAGVLGLNPGELPGLASVCDLLSIPAGDHTAAADVAATAACFQALFEKAGIPA